MLTSGLSAGFTSPLVRYGRRAFGGLISRAKPQTCSRNCYREHGLTPIAERRNASDRPLIYARWPGDPAVDGLAWLGGMGP